MKLTFHTMWEWIRNRIHLVLSFAILSGIGFGVRAVLKSPLFIAESVVVTDLLVQREEEPRKTPATHSKLTGPLPLPTETILKLASIPVGKVSVFDLDLPAIEARILSNRWVSQVRLEKRLPNSLLISVAYRKPKVLIQKKSGALVYADSEGNQFGPVDMMDVIDLPVVSVHDCRSRKKFTESIKFIERWETMSLNRAALISSFYWEPDQGFHALVVYPMDSQKIKTMVHFGQDIDGHLDVKFFQLLKVFQYLSKNSIVSHQIRADVGKKVVVKTSEGS